MFQKFIQYITKLMKHFFVLKCNYCCIVEHLSRATLRINFLVDYLMLVGMKSAIQRAAEGWCSY